MSLETEKQNKTKIYVINEKKKPNFLIDSQNIDDKI